jgi:hypothetical protein
MSIDPGNSPCGRTVEKLDRAYREANRLVVAAGLVLAAAGVPRRAPAIKALSAAVRAVNEGRALVRSTPPLSPMKENPDVHVPTLGRRFRRAVP